MLARVFLADNGVVLKFDQWEAIRIMETLASGLLDMSRLAAWLRERIVG
ncbi:prophage maintenance system killer protein [Oxalobacteraceae bacterium GrIS 1.11]